MLQGVGYVYTCWVGSGFQYYSPKPKPHVGFWMWAQHFPVVLEILSCGDYCRVWLLLWKGDRREGEEKDEDGKKLHRYGQIQGKEMWIERQTDR